MAIAAWTCELFWSTGADDDEVEADGPDPVAEGALLPAEDAVVEPGEVLDEPALLAHPAAVRRTAPTAMPTAVRPAIR